MAKCRVTLHKIAVVPLHGESLSTNGRKYSPSFRNSGLPVLVSCPQLTRPTRRPVVSFVPRYILNGAPFLSGIPEGSATCRDGVTSTTSSHVHDETSGGRRPDRSAKVNDIGTNRYVTPPAPSSAAGIVRLSIASKDHQGTPSPEQLLQYDI